MVANRINDNDLDFTPDKDAAAEMLQPHQYRVKAVAETVRQLVAAHATFAALAAIHMRTEELPIALQATVDASGAAISAVWAHSMAQASTEEKGPYMLAKRTKVSDMLSVIIEAMQRAHVKSRAAALAMAADLGIDDDGQGSLIQAVDFVCREVDDSVRKMAAKLKLDNDWPPIVADKDEKKKDQQ